MYKATCEWPYFSSENVSARESATREEVAHSYPTIVMSDISALGGRLLN